MAIKDKLIIGIDMGHTLSGEGTGAQGCGYKEQDLTRELGKKVIGHLKSLGHTVIDCTVDKASSNSAQLSERVRKANAYNLDIFVSIHFNACVNDQKGDGKTTGTEVLICKGSTRAKTFATNVVNEIASIGLKNRGVKESTVYVVKNTKAPAILIETCFIDDRDDMNIYLKNVDKTARAIVKGLTGQTIVDAPTNAPEGLYAVCVGAYAHDTAVKMKNELISKGYKDTYLIKR